MRVAEYINLIAFAFFLALAWLRPLESRRRAKISAIAALGLSLTLATQLARHFLSPLPVSVMRDWLPAVLLLMPYWAGGQFFRAPNDALQRRLTRFDHRLFTGLEEWADRRKPPALITTYFELAYLFCYPLVPLGLAVLYVVRMGRYADEFWTIVLPPTYLCDAMLPFIQTLPPRLLGAMPLTAGPKSQVRSFNLWILHHASIQQNTFPSAHVAASTAVALELLRRVPYVGSVFLWAALSIAIGAVAGRYHHAADVLLGAGLAIVWFVVVGVAFP